MAVVKSNRPIKTGRKLKSEKKNPRATKWPYKASYAPGKKTGAKEEKSAQRVFIILT